LLNHLDLACVHREFAQLRSRKSVGKLLFSCWAVFFCDKKPLCRKLGILKWPFRDRHLNAKNIAKEKSCAAITSDHSDTESQDEQAQPMDSCVSPVSTDPASPTEDMEDDDSSSHDQPDIVASRSSSPSSPLEEMNDPAELAQLSDGELAPSCEAGEDERYWSDAATVNIARTFAFVRRSTIRFCLLSFK
jgi:hypothetical protein